MYNCRLCIARNMKVYLLYDTCFKFYEFSKTFFFSMFLVFRYFLLFNLSRNSRQLYCFIHQEDFLNSLMRNVMPVAHENKKDGVKFYTRRGTHRTSMCKSFYSMYSSDFES